MKIKHNINKEDYNFLDRKKICSNSKFNVFFDHLIAPNELEIKDFLTVTKNI